MTPASDAANAWQHYLWIIGIVFSTNLILGLIENLKHRAPVALVQATAFTAVVMVATDPHGFNSTSAIAIPMIWVPCFAISWLGLFAGNKATSRGN